MTSEIREVIQQNLAQARTARISGEWDVCWSLLEDAHVLSQPWVWPHVRVHAAMLAAYTVLAPGRPEALVEQWSEIKAAASEALIAAGGTITHHHAVGRDHRPWYDRQRPEGFARALRAAKSDLDPKAILNPGVLIDPVRPANS